MKSSLVIEPHTKERSRKTRLVDKDQEHNDMNLKKFSSIQESDEFKMMPFARSAVFGDYVRMEPKIALKTTQPVKKSRMREVQKLRKILFNLP